MLNPYVPKFAKIIDIKEQSPDSKLFSLQHKDKSDFSFTHGQFIQIGMFGLGEAPFSICSSTYNNKSFDIVVRDVGDLTKKLHGLTVGNTVTARGPFGNGFPMDKFKDKNTLLIGGGCGFVAMRSFILDYKAKK